MDSKTKNIVTVCLIGALLFGTAIWCWLKPTDTYSDSERRVLASFPELSTDTVFSGKFMNNFEAYTQDQFPLREKLRTLQSFTAFYIMGHRDNNDIFIEDGHLSKLEYPLNDKMTENAAERFRFIYDTYLAGSNANIYLSIVPDKNYYLAEPNGYPTLDYDKLISDMRGSTEYMTYIDITDHLTLEDYYCTDTHWRQESIVDTARYISSAMGITLSAEYAVNTLDNPFYGVYCGQSALPCEPDTIHYLTNDIINNCIVTGYDTGTPVQKEMYDMTDAYGKDPYEMFLSGAEALLTIENPNASTDKELILFRDSFGSSIAPLFAEGYKKITIVDIRYISSSMLGSFIEFDNRDVLFLYSTILLNNSLAFK